MLYDPIHALYPPYQKYPSHEIMILRIGTYLAELNFSCSAHIFEKFLTWAVNQYNNEIYHNFVSFLILFYSLHSILAICLLALKVFETNSPYLLSSNFKSPPAKIFRDGNWSPNTPHVWFQHYIHIMVRELDRGVSRHLAADHLF